MDGAKQTIIFGGGCFWCTEAVFQRLKGVISVMPGFSGGTVEHPTSEQVYSMTTGHAEVSKVEYDPSIISLQDLLSVFFAIHDPTSLNKQGADVGPIYRSVIFYTSNEQKNIIEKFISKLESDQVFDKPLVTEVTAFTNFYEADEYHRDYYNRNINRNPYCQVVINPKLSKLKEKFNKLIKE